MKAISIRQPWAWLIIAGFKDIENRDWKDWNPGLKVRGRVLVHASQGMTQQEYLWCVDTCHKVAKTRPFPPGTRLPGFKYLERGGIRAGSVT